MSFNSEEFNKITFMILNPGYFKRSYVWNN